MLHETQLDVFVVCEFFLCLAIVEIQQYDIFHECGVRINTSHILHIEILIVFINL